MQIPIVQVSEPFGQCWAFCAVGHARRVSVQDSSHRYAAIAGAAVRRSTRESIVEEQGVICSRAKFDFRAREVRFDLM